MRLTALKACCSFAENIPAIWRGNLDREGLLLVCGKYTKEYERSRRHPLWNVGAGAFEIFSAEKINVVEVNEAYAPNGLTEMLSKFLCRFETS